MRTSGLTGNLACPLAGGGVQFTFRAPSNAELDGTVRWECLLRTE